MCVKNFTLYYAAALFAFVTCTKELPLPDWNNPVDPQSNNYSIPKITNPKILRFGWNEEATINVSATDSNGKIEKYLWKTSLNQEWDTTTIPQWNVKYAKGGLLLVTVKAVDNNGLSDTATIQVLFNRRPEGIKLDYPVDGRRHIFDEMDSVDSLGTIFAFGFKTIDPDSAVDSFRYVIEVIDTLNHKVKKFESVNDAVKIDSLLSDHFYKLKIRSYDLYGDSIAFEKVIYTQKNYIPTGMVHFPRDPEHGVYHPFWIDTTEVTVEMYGKTAKKVYNPVLSKMPQIIQTQEELDSYFKSINTGFTDIGFRLPYQEEWLRAFRKPDGRKLCYWGEEMHQDIVKSYAWYNLNAKASDWSSPHAEIDGVQNVAQLLPNAYGLYDMSGNAAELLRIKRSPSYYVYFTNEAWYAEGVIGGDAYSSVEKLVPEHYPDSKFKGFRKVYGQYF